MEKAEIRLFEEWKANNDLLKFHEELKEKRFAHFLTIQTAFLAFFALLAKDALVSLSMVSLTALVLIAVPPLIISFYFIRVDTRSRAFVDTANTRLLLIEKEWQDVSPDSHFSTYQQLFAVLSRHDEAMVGLVLSLYADLNGCCGAIDRLLCACEPGAVCRSDKLSRCAPL
jgi:hypothetical protein